MKKLFVNDVVTIEQLTELGLKYTVPYAGCKTYTGNGMVYLMKDAPNGKLCVYIASEIKKDNQTA